MDSQKIVQNLGRFLKWLIVGFIVCYILLLAINAVDEAPSPEYQSIVSLPVIKTDPNNGYLALVGINAPANESPVTYGTKWVVAYNAASSSNAIEWVAQIVNESNRSTKDSAYNWRVLYNLTGKLNNLSNQRTEQFSIPVLRLFDLIGVTRLARLQVEILTASEMPNVATEVSVNKSLYNPYTLKPMSWDPIKREFYFTGKGSGLDQEKKIIRVAI